MDIKKYVCSKPEECGGYSTNDKSNLNRHMRGSKHNKQKRQCTYCQTNVYNLYTHKVRCKQNPNRKQIPCKAKDCKEKVRFFATKTEMENHFFRHHAIIKTDDLISCKHSDCKNSEKKFKTKGDLRRHKYNVHLVGIKWYSCHLCDKKFKTNAKLGEHLAGPHGIGIDYLCDVPECEYSNKIEYKLLAHRKKCYARYYKKQSIRKKWYVCPHCNLQKKVFKTRKTSNFKQHLTQVHDIGGTLYKCEYCIKENKETIYETKNKSNLIHQHYPGVHGINIKEIYTCTEYNETLAQECGYFTFKKSHFKRHLSNIHDIGDKKCPYCWHNCHTLIEYDKDPKGNIRICTRCYKSLTGHKTRIEKKTFEYLAKNFKYPLLKRDQPVKGDACLKYRPDGMYGCCFGDLVIYVEIDENEHRWSNYACEEKRMSELYCETSGKKVFFVRWNPNNYKPKKGYTKIKTQKERLDLLVKTLTHITKDYQKYDTLLNVLYICYSHNNQNIVKRLQKKMIYNENDLKANLLYENVDKKKRKMDTRNCKVKKVKII